LFGFSLFAVCFMSFLLSLLQRRIKLNKSLTRNVHFRDVNRTNLLQLLHKRFEPFGALCNVEHWNAEARLRVFSGRVAQQLACSIHNCLPAILT